MKTFCYLLSNLSCRDHFIGVGVHTADFENLLEKVRERSELQGLSGGDVFDRTGAEGDLQFVPSFTCCFMSLYSIIGRHTADISLLRAFIFGNVPFHPV